MTFRFLGSVQYHILGGLAFIALAGMTPPLFAVDESATATTSPTTHPTSEAALLKFHADSSLMRLGLLRATAKEADLTDAQRQQVMKLIDNADQALHDLIDEHAASTDGSDQDWQVKRDRIFKDFAHGASTVISDPVANASLGKTTGLISTEISLIEKGSLADEMSKLNLTDDQTQKLKAIADQPAAEMAHPASTDPSDPVPENERKQTIALAARTRVRELLTDDQRSAWTDALIQLSKQHQGAPVIHLRPVPPPAP